MKILFGVFDWGLGHATRDILLIEELLKKGNKIDIISTGYAMKLLQDRFGNKCRYFDVPSIHVPYSKSRFFTFHFVKNIYRMISTLKKAREKTKEIIDREKYDKVISDCRYDVYDRVENSYLINHQLRFKSFFLFQIIGELWLANRMRRYKYMLVPDFEQNSLSGKLSHDLIFINKDRVKYIGILSQLSKKNLKKDIDFFVSISGPEPQRTLFEENIITQIRNLKGKKVITLGKPGNKLFKEEGDIIIFDFLDSKKQEEMMNKSKVIISRSGYTTMMEFSELGIKKALLIPTPGQTEQEYLSKLYEKNKYFHSVSQYKLNLKEDLLEIEDFTGFNNQWKTKDSIKKFIEFIN